MTDDTLQLAPDYLAELFGDHRELVDQYFGIWAALPDQVNAMASQYQGTNLVQHVEANSGRGTANIVGRDLRADVEWLNAQRIEAAVGDRRLFPLTGNGVGIIRIQGPMMKFVSSLSGGTSTKFVRRQLRQASADDEVGSVLLVIDSPGGTVAGTQDLAADIASLASRKPVETLAEDLIASAAFWAGSQANKLWAANRTTLAGSIGTYAILYDLSGRAEKMGIGVRVVKAGEFKAMGAAGTEITEAQLAEMQRIVDSLNAEFLAGVARGRGINEAQVKQLADGRVHTADQAEQLGLVDGIRTLDQVIDGLSRNQPKRRMLMTHNTNTNQDGKADVTEPAGATLKELKAAFPDASSDFTLAQLEAGATLTAAHQAYASELKAENERLKQEAEKAKADAAEKAEADQAGKTGQGLKQPIGEGPSTPAGEGTDYNSATGDPVHDYDAAVRQFMETHPKATRQQAAAKVAKRSPELHQAFLVATNPTRKARRQIEEKYEQEAEYAKRD